MVSLPVYVSSEIIESYSGCVKYFNDDILNTFVIKNLSGQN